MGLSESRKRAKLTLDPNNTAWSRSSSKYGQRILESHGWIPGNFLGAEKAPHASLHTRANASHIRVAIKDDNLGLGARHGGGQNGEPTGLNMFQDLLGRLNGRSNKELDQERVARCNLRQSAVVDRRWGRLRFVSGGLLVGDDLQRLCVKKPVAHTSDESPIIPAKAVMKEARNDEVSTEALRQMKRRKPKKPTKELVRSETTRRDMSTMQSGDRKELLAGEQLLTSKSPFEEDVSEQALRKEKRKAGKAERKLKRKLRREARQKKHPASISLDAAECLSLQSSGLGNEKDAKQVSPESNLSSKTPVALRGGRNAVRQRYIQQKKMSMMNSRALNEILMVKSKDDFSP